MKKKVIKKLIYEYSLLKKLINIDKINLKNEQENKKDISNSIDKEENNIINKSIYNNNISNIRINNYNDDNINIITKKNFLKNNIIL